MKFIVSKSGTISAKYKDSSGKWRRTCLRTKDEAEAHKIAEELRLDDLETAGKMGILSREVVAKLASGKDIKLKKVVAEWAEFRERAGKSKNSIYTQSCSLMQFMRDYGYRNAGISAVSEDDIFDFLNRADKASLATRKQRKSTMKSLFDFASGRMYVVFNPTTNICIDKSRLSHVQKETKETIPFTEGEFRKVLKYAPYFFRQATGISYWTGLRFGDICSLEWASISSDSIIVHTEKRDKRVVLPLDHELFGGGELRGILLEIDVFCDQYCFPDWQEEHRDPVKRARACERYGELMKSFGINKRFHSLRHAFVTRLRNEGVALEEIAEVVGHSSTETTRGYLH